MTVSPAPLAIEPALRQRAQAVVRHVASALRARPGAFGNQVGFAGGLAGAAVFFAYAQRVLPGEGFDAEARRFIQLGAYMLDDPCRPTWLNGFTGAAWALDLAARLVPATPRPVAFEEQEQRLEEQLDAGALTPEDWDPIHGWGSMLLYAALRPGRSAAIAQRAFDALLASMQEDEDGAFWVEKPEQFASDDLMAAAGPVLRANLEHARALHPDGRCNLGTAHGMAGLIGCLSAAVHTRCAPPEAAEVLASACNWYALQRSAGNSSCMFTSFQGDTNPSRLAWCYGDPGVALQLFHAARVLDRADLAALARETALCAARRPLQGSGVDDAGLCHGSAGLVQLFARLHAYCGEPALATAWQRWLNHTLDQFDAQLEFGFRVAGGDVLGHNGADAALLEGATGVGLVLLDVLDPQNQEWDSAVLASLPLVAPRPSIG